MPFYPNDYYTVSGGVNANTLWTPFVTKFDSSSFYNWEQDNLPLYDLDERTEYLWSKAGYPTSSVAGMALVVSANNYYSAKNVFSDIQSAIKALPNPITFPIMIEVAASGDLGHLSLEDISVLDGGALEIVNRVFAKSYAGVENTSSVTQTYDAVRTRQVATFSSLDLSNTMAETSALSVSGTTVELWGNMDTAGGNQIRAFFGVPNTQDHEYETDLLSTDFRNNSGNFRTTSPNVFSLKNYEATATGQIKDRTTSSIYVAGYTPSGLDVSTFHQTLFVQGLRGDGSLNTPLNEVDLYRKLPTIVNKPSLVGLAYGNRFKSVKVHNCGGPIYLRGLCVDGDTGEAADTMGSYVTEDGFSIVNSDVVLENCAATRCPESGFNFQDSKVRISRGIIAFRNYKILNNTVDPTLIARKKGSAGIRAVNSELTVSSSLLYASGTDFLFWSTRNPIGMELINSTLKGGDSRLKESSTPFADVSAPTFVSLFYNSEHGLKATNSTVAVNGRLDCYNNEVGIGLDNSKLLVDELTVEYSNSTGLYAVNSHIQYNKNSIRTDYASGTDYETYLQQGQKKRQIEFWKNAQHMVLNNSVIDFKHEPDVYTKFGTIRAAYNHGVTFKLPTNRRKNTLPGIELQNNSKANLLNARLETGKQRVDAITNPTRNPRELYGESSFQATEGCYGAAIKITDNSQAVFHGTTEGITTILGPIDFTQQRKTAAIYAGDNSKVSFQGPTRIVGFGVDVLAENHSEMNFCPHLREDKMLDISGFNLIDTENHTTVELHALRSCLVATDHSKINMKDLGDYHATWTETAAPNNFLAADYQTGEDLIFDLDKTSFRGTPYNTSAQYKNIGFNTSAYHKAGSIMFLPNPDDYTMHLESQSQYTSKWDNTFITGDNPGMYVLASGPIPCEMHTLVTLQPWHTYGMGGTGASAVSYFRSSYSKGGQCVRVLENSECNVKNVHFLTASINTSGAHYDASVTRGTTGWGDHDLKIWNVNRDSKLNATYCSVSGVYPGELTNLHGPSSVYASGSVHGTGGPAANAFVSLLKGGDNEKWSSVTGYLSLLDNFGKNTGATNTVTYGISKGDENYGHTLLQWLRGYRTHNIMTAGTSTFENRGPFRLYFDPNPLAKSLSYLSGTSPHTTPPNQNSAHVGNWIIEDNTPYQHVAQGYNMSGAASSVNNFSSIDPGKYLSFTASSTVAPVTFSGVFFQTELYDLGNSTGNRGGPAQTAVCVDADESALNTFANAKHNSLGMRSTYNSDDDNYVTDQVQFVNIVQPTISPGGDGARIIAGDEGHIPGKGFKPTTKFDLRSEN
jgi:hypothetical protein